MIGWIKSNLGIVLLLIVTVAVPPVTWFISSGWNKDIRDGQQQLAEADFNKLIRASVNYSVPSLVPGQGQIQLNEVPNAKLTAWFLEQREQQVAEAKGLIELGEARNRRQHGTLIDDLFPDPEPSQRQIKPMQFVKTITPGADPRSVSAYEQLLKKINAGSVADASQLGDVLADFKEREIARIKSQSGQASLTLEQTSEMRVKLQSRRIGAYQGRAREISCYATLDAFSRKNDASPFVPINTPSKPGVEQCFAWQHDYWVTTDILDTIAAANTGPDGRLLPLERGVVKRIEKIRMSDLPIFQMQKGNRGEGGYNTETRDRGSQSGDETARPTTIEGTVPVNYSVSLTGRFNNKDDNKVYDVRKVELFVVVSSARILELLDAIERTGFMEVLDVDLSEIDIWRDLEGGYYYGPEHVVRAKLDIETVWLRSWTTQYAPTMVRNILGFAKDETAGERDDG